MTRLMIAVGRALASAHQQGVVHRDFKPENVVIDDEGKPYVIDFGIALDETEASEAYDEARAVDDSLDDRASESGSHTRLTVHGNVVGTPAYMAPEQRTGHCGPSIDQFAYCVSFFELLYGERPFEGQSTTEEVRRAMRVPVVPPGKVRRGEVPAWLYRVLAQGVEFETEQRHASMTELCDTLEAGLERWQRRWWYRAWAGVLLSLAVVLGATDVVTAEMLMPEEPCPDVRQEWAGIWDEARASEIEATILGTGLNYAAETWSLLKPNIEDSVRDWLEVCEATRVRGDAPEADLDVRMECLRLNKKRQAALLGVFAEADGKVVEGAIKAFSGLPPVRECADAERLRDEVPWPEGSVKRAKVEAMRGVLAEAQAAMEAGQHTEAGEIVQGLETSVRGLGFAGLEAEWELQRGHLAGTSGDPRGAEQHYERGAEFGQLAGHRRVVAEASLALMYVQGYALNDQAAAWAAAKRAESALEGVREEGHLRGGFLDMLGLLSLVSGRHEDAEALLRDAVETLRVDVGERHWAYQNALGNLAVANSYLGRPEKSIRIGQRVIQLIERTSGASHPTLAVWHNNLGLGLINKGQVSVGLGYLRSALTVCEASTEAPHAACSWNRQELAENLGHAGCVTEALNLLDRNALVQRQQGRRSNPHTHWTPKRQSQLWLVTGHLDRAIQSAREGWREMANDVTAAPHMKASALVELARAELEAGLVGVARAHVERALELVPEGAFGAGSERPRALRVLGNLMLEEGHPDKALKLQTMARDVYAKDFGPEDPHLDLARTHVALNNHPQALLHTHKAIQLQTSRAMGENHTLTPHYAQLGRIHLAMGRPGRARAAFQHGLSLYDENILHPDRRIELDDGLAKADAALTPRAIATRGDVDESHIGPVPALAG